MASTLQWNPVELRPEGSLREGDYMFLGPRVVMVFAPIKLFNKKLTFRASPGSSSHETQQHSRTEHVMAQKFMKKLSSGLLFTSLILATACTKKRDAKMPEDEAEGTFAISELDLAYKQESNFSLKTSAEMRALDQTEILRADYENGVVIVDEDSVQVPARLRYMFTHLEMAGQTNQTYQLAFSVDNKAVTALKVVSDAEGLSRMESQIAISKEEINLQKKIQVSRNAPQTQKLLKQLAEAQKNRSGPLYVPIFKFEVKAYGALERTKNSLGEETSTLRLKGTDWSQATHIQISINPDHRIMVAADPGMENELDRVFVADRLNNKLTSAGQLSSQLDIQINLPPSTPILTLMDTNSLRIYEITTKSKINLTSSQKEILRNKGSNGEIEECSAEIKKSLPVDLQEGCLLIQRFNIPISYVKATLPVVNYNGTRGNSVKFETASASENTGLVKITRNVMPEEVQPTGTLDPRKTLLLADIKNKEFFFRRTLEDTNAMGTLVGGMAGSVQLVKFVLQDHRIVVQKTVGALDFRKSTSMESEEVLSLPVTYIKRQTKDAAGNALAIPKYVPTTKEDAEYATLDWTNNSIPVLDSPLAFYADAQCFRNVNNQEVVDTDMRLSEGVLNFSYLYSVTMDARTECLNIVSPAGDYFFNSNIQFTQQVRERISFKVNDGSTDEAFVPTTPFRAQNALNYGVFTQGVIRPSENGGHGREGSQLNFPVVHDFRNGKKFLYTVGGLPDNDLPRRSLLKKVTQEVVSDWNKALHKAFAGTPLQRDGDYIELQYVGENGVQANLGDLDKNLIWFVDRPTSQSLLGVSQVGTNPRSGVVAADSLIVYNGNSANQVESFRKFYAILKEYKKGLQAYKEAELAKDSDREKTKQGEKDPQVEEQKAVASSVAGAPAAQKLFAQLKSAQKSKKLIQERFSPRFQWARPLVKSPSLTLNKSPWTAQGKSFAALTSEQGYIDRLFKKAIEMKLGRDPSALESLTAKEILSTYGSKMTAQQKVLLQQKASLMDLHGRMDQFFKKNPGCALRMSDSLIDSLHGGNSSLSDDQMLANYVKMTLAHEMGHSLGLTHNFIGSYDKTNFTFEGEKSKRNYSSIMDYMDDALQIYDGLGPYDVYAIRASYTGLLEVHPKVRSQSALTEMGFKGNLISDRFIHIQDVKANDAKMGWANFSGGLSRRLVMPFKYCTDKDVEYEPTCQRHDFGTTPAEIVKNAIEDYENRYIVSRYAWDRIDFNWENKSYVMAHTLRTMLGLRQYLDEAFYRVIVGIDEDIDSEHFKAAYESYKFFLNVITMPDTDKDLMDYSRFEKVTYEVPGAEGKAKNKKVTDFIEARTQADFAMSPDRYHSFGNNDDKALALEVLTLKGLGYEKYASMNLSVSFVDFESTLGLLDDDSIGPVAFTLLSILGNQLPGRVYKDDAILKSRNPVTIDSRLTTYAAISAVLGLESASLDERDNYATLFKVGSSLGQNVPKDRLSLSPLGSVKNSSARMSFWALDNARAAQILISGASEKNFFLDLGDQLVSDTATLLKAQATLIVNETVQDKTVEEAQNKLVSSAKDALLKTLTAANQDGKIVSPEAVAQFPDLALDTQLETVEVMHLTLMELTSEWIKAKTPEEKQKVQGMAEKLRAGFGNIAAQLPVTLAAQKAAVKALNIAAQQRQDELKEEDPTKDPQWVLLKTTASISNYLYQSYQQEEQAYGATLRNLDFLSKLTTMTNPEYNR